MSEQTAEKRRTEVVRRVFRLIAVDAVAPAGTRPASVTAESIVSLLESGDAGVYLVAGADVQGTVGIVLGQLREARAEIERLRALLDRSRQIPDADRIAAMRLEAGL